MKIGDQGRLSRKLHRRDKYLHIPVAEKKVGTFLWKLLGLLGSLTPPPPPPPHPPPLPPAPPGSCAQDSDGLFGQFILNTDYVMGMTVFRLSFVCTSGRSGLKSDS